MNNLTCKLLGHKVEQTPSGVCVCTRCGADDFYGDPVIFHHYGFFWNLYVKFRHCQWKLAMKVRNYKYNFRLYCIRHGWFEESFDDGPF